MAIPVARPCTSEKTPAAAQKIAVPAAATRRDAITTARRRPVKRFWVFIVLSSMPVGDQVGQGALSACGLTDCV
jgi:hypothetical protein